MPLDRCEKKSKITFDIVIPGAHCYFGIDEIQFSIEPCLTFQQGGSAWMRKSGKLFKTSKKQNSDGSITAFYHSRLSSSLNHGSPTRTPSFIDVISPDLVNYIVSNAKPSNHSEISVGARVFVENNPDTASLGTVIMKDETPSKYKLTARLDCNGSDIDVLNRKVYLLPYQLDRHGPKWRTTNRCLEQYKSSCVFFTNSLNWFDAADYCKARGAELGKIYSEDEEKNYKTLYSKNLPFWVGYHGHKHRGKKFVWNDDSEDVFNKLSNKSLKNGLSAGLCSLVTKDPLWQRTNCSEAHSVLCTQPGRQLKILNYCDSREDVQKLSCEISKTVLLIKKAELDAVTDEMPVIKNKNCSQLYISSKHHLLAEIKAMCQGRRECNISVKSITNDPCPLERKRINIEYKCLVQSRGYPVLAERNSAFSPREWKKFRASYYKADARKTIWKEARAICEMERGATLVSIEDKQEENYVMNLMSSIGLNVSHIGLTAKEYPGNFEWLDGSKSSYRNWVNDTVKSFAGEPIFVAVGFKGWLQSFGNYTAGFICKYTPGVGGCDFETGWCGWKDTSAESCCPWSRSKGIDDTSTKSTLSGVYKTEQTSDVYIYQFLNEERKDIFFKVDRPKEMNRLTLCLWVYVDNKSISGATIVLFGKKLGVKIYYEKDLKFVVGFYDWNATTNATVSIDSWQHICFLIDTIENLWSFYKDGGLTDIALSRVSKFSSDALDTDDNQVFLGQETKCSFECSNFKQFFGKMTKPVMWSKIIDAHEILALSSGCGIFREAGDMEIYKNSELDMHAKLVDHGECTAGKGFRLQCRKISNASTITFPSASTLVSPWMRSSLYSVRGICMNFTYRLLGLDSQIAVWFEPRNTVKERLWSVKSSRKHDLWKNGQLSLGLVSSFRVHVTATLWSNLSEVKVDNIFFTEGYCSPVPKNAQEWHTHVANSSSGYLTSPYYPSVYLNNMKRSWKIEVPQDQRINLTVLFMNLEDAKHCSRDSIVFKDTFFSRKYTSYCGNTFPVGYLSTRNVVYVTFQSDESQVRTGFKIHYQAISIDKDSCQKNDIIDCPSTLRCHPFGLKKSKIYVYAENVLRMPDYFPEKTTAINFDGNALVTLTTFVNLTSLEFLSISDNKLISIDEKTFHDLTSLRALRLPSNFLKDIPRDVFRAVKSLEMLDLSMNRLYKLDKTLFLDLNYLRLLSLRKNRIRLLEDGMFSNLRKLQYLYLDGNDLSNLGSKVFNANSALRTLILKNNKLKKVKKSWLRGKLSLVTLKLQNNKIK
ncbi:uncharacterized protein LOC114536799 [Dendronephthya gigantea]|uniref:uncharacterized protein LOC114536799 n=1 Tax=Dendronephthya gigantea TaxID=151771 RepID=UPI00106DAD30|nr:uncharacterized protein LOC114536799 [Dendronephthya gigantea]